MNDVKHIPALDGLRALAAGLVVLSHLQSLGYVAAYPPHSGTFGVMIFFVLSGFLMGHLYLSKPFTSSSIIYYFSARFGRIVPLFYVTIICSFILSNIFGKSYPYYIDTHQLIRHLLFTGSKFVFWSIPPEVGFYVTFAFLWWLISSGNGQRFVMNLVIVLAVIFILAPAMPGIVVFSKLHIFLAGVAVAVIHKRLNLDRVSRRMATATQVTSLLFLLAVITGLLPLEPSRLALAWERDDAIYTSVPMAMLFGGMLLAFTIETRFANTILGNRLAKTLGAYSFGIYLLHEPIIVAVTVVTKSLGWPAMVSLSASLIAVVAAAAFSFRWFEMPVQRAIRRAATAAGTRFSCRSDRESVLAP